MKTPRLKDWVNGQVQIAMFVRTATGMTAEFVSRLVGDHNVAGIAETVGLFLIESRPLAEAVVDDLCKRLGHTSEAPATLTAKRESVLIKRKGKAGWILSLTDSGSYVECWLRGDVRCLELNLFDGERDAAWAASAVVALQLAACWVETGVMDVTDMGRESMEGGTS